MRDTWGERAALEVLRGGGSALDALSVGLPWASELLEQAKKILRDPDAAQDAAQDAWIGALEHAKALADDPEYGRLREWLHAAVRREARGRKRREGRRRRREQQWGEETA